MHKQEQKKTLAALKLKFSYILIDSINTSKIQINNFFTVLRSESAPTFCASAKTFTTTDLYTLSIGLAVKRTICPLKRYFQTVIFTAMLKAKLRILPH